MNCFKLDDRGSDPRIGGVVAPDLRGVNLVPHHLRPPPPATLTLTPTFSTLKHYFDTTTKYRLLTPIFNTL